MYVETSTVGPSKINGVYGANKEAALARAVEKSPDGSLTEADQNAAV